MRQGTVREDPDVLLPALFSVSVDDLCLFGLDLKSRYLMCFDLEI